MAQGFKNTQAITNTPVLITDIFKHLSYFDAFNPDEQVYIQMFDTDDETAVVLGTTTPNWVHPVPLKGGHSEQYGINDYFQGVPFNTGLVIAATTTRSGAVAPGTATDINLLMV